MNLQIDLKLYGKMIKRKSDDMTVTIKSNTNNNYHVSLDMENRYGNDVYIVQACPCIDDSRCGYPEKEMIYSIVNVFML